MIKASDSNILTSKQNEKFKYVPQFGI